MPSVARVAIRSHGEKPWTCSREPTRNDIKPWLNCSRPAGDPRYRARTHLRELQGCFGRDSSQPRTDLPPKAGEAVTGAIWKQSVASSLLFFGTFAVFEVPLKHPKLTIEVSGAGVLGTKVRCRTKDDSLRSSQAFFSASLRVGRLVDAPMGYRSICGASARRWLGEPELATDRCS